MIRHLLLLSQLQSDSIGCILWYVLYVQGLITCFCLFQEFDIDPECDTDQVDDLLTLCVRQATNQQPGAVVAVAANVAGAAAAATTTAAAATSAAAAAASAAAGDAATTQ